MKYTQRDFLRGRSTTDQFLEKTWEYAKDVYTCFVDLEKACNQVPREKFWGVLREYGADGRLLLTVKSLYFHKFVSVSAEFNLSQSP